MTLQRNAFVLRTTLSAWFNHGEYKTMKLVRNFILLAALLLIAVPAFAQDELTQYGLSDADAELFTSANENSVVFDTLTYEFTLEVTADGEQAANLNGSGVIGADDGIFSMDVSGDLTLGGDSTDAALEVRVVEGTGYFSLGDMGWYEVTAEDLESILAMAGQAGGTGGMLPFDPSALGQGDLGGMSGDSMEAMGDMDPTDFVSITREDNMDGMAHFVIALDLEAIAENEAFMDAFTEQMEAQNQAMDAEDIQAALAGGVLTFEQFIDTETEQVATSVLALEVDNLDFTFTIDFVYDEPVEVEAPEDAEPFMELLQMFMGGMGSM